MDEHTHTSKRNVFSRVAHWCADIMGTSKAFFVSCVIVVVWAATGPFFHYSDAWQLVINSAMNIITFLLVVLLQHTQNHDSKSIQLKLDELIRSVKTARNSMVDLEAMTDAELESLHREFQEIRERSLRKNGQLPTP
jgi:low affinity Fe/Cu permease